MNTPREPIPSERKLVCYAGTGLTGLGVLLFLSTLFPFTASFGNLKSEVFRAFGGMALIVIGSYLMTVVARGWPTVLAEPRRAREDIESWSRVAAGPLDDPLSEVMAVRKMEQKRARPEVTAGIRCSRCEALNDRAAKFCDQCGMRL